MTIFITSDQENQIWVAALREAFAVLQPLLSDEESFTTYVLACIKAFAAAESAINRAIDEIKRSEEKPDDGVRTDVSATMVVCSAIANVYSRPEAIPRNSVGAMHVLALMHAIVAVKHFDAGIQQLNRDHEFPETEAAGLLARILSSDI